MNLLQDQQTYCNSHIFFYLTIQIPSLQYKFIKGHYEGPLPHYYFYYKVVFNFISLNAAGGYNKLQVAYCNSTSPTSKKMMEIITKQLVALGVGAPI